ncbi:MAG: carboxypeptidase-like regulatory domain-containing protein, partial [Petrimonas sp.]|nr:carboxypeptidase-like regulatory domain-containing protein [Petrimonas sp.]
MKKFIFILFSLFLLNTGLMLAQTLIKGVVLEESGEPVIGASIQIKGTGQGTVTDIDGNFSLTVPTGTNVLVVSYVGLKTLEVVAQPNMRIVLQSDVELLDEVVVVGYGTVRKRDLTGSVGQVSSNNIKDLNISNATQALAGQISGVSVQQGSG